MSRRALSVAGAALLLVALVGSAQLTLARFRDDDSSRARFTATTLQPPTALTGTGGTGVSLAWTASTSGWGTGYQVLRSNQSGSGYSQIDQLTPVTRQSTTDSPADGTWYYVLQTYFHNWVSVPSNEAMVKIGPQTTAFADCDSTKNSPVTSNAGDNNGYEGLPNKACLRDGVYATDSSTGTSTTNSCTATTKDRHDFWGYAIDIPASISSVKGITIRPVVGESNNGGTSWLCIQLSWDDGGHWTTPVPNVVLTDSALTAYTLGGPSDTWGRTWTRAELRDHLRIRVIDSSTHPVKQLRLDAIQVAVTYLP